MCCSCCFTDHCNEGPRFSVYPVQFSPSLPPALSTSGSVFPSRLGPGPAPALATFPRPSFDPAPAPAPNLNRVPSYLQQFTQRNGNCDHYFDKINADEWIPDTLVPLAFDRASGSRVGVFYTKLGEDLRGNNDYIIVRIRA